MPLRVTPHLHRDAHARPDAAFPVFVYGTLRPPFGNFDRLLAGAAERVRPAHLPGAVLLDNQQYPYAVRSAHPTDVVTGELVTFAAGSAAAALARLDRAFGRVAGARANRWERRRMTVRCDGAGHEAWVYVAADWLAPRLRATLPTVAGGDWVRHVTSTWLALHQRGRRGVGAHDGHGICWSTFDRTRAGVGYAGWPAEATEDAFTDPAPGYLDLLTPTARRHLGRHLTPPRRREAVAR